MTPVAATIRGLLLAGTALLDGLLVSRARAALHGAVRHELAGLRRLVHSLSHQCFLLPSLTQRNDIAVVSCLSYLILFRTSVRFLVLQVTKRNEMYSRVLTRNQTQLDDTFCCDQGHETQATESRTDVIRRHLTQREAVTS